MSPGPSRSAAATIACEELWSLNDEAPTHAPGAMPVMPKVLRSPLTSPSTAVPWLTKPTSVVPVPATTPPWLASRSSWVNRQPHSQSMTHACAPAAGHGPGVAGVDAAGRGLEVALPGRQVRRRRRRAGRRRGHGVGSPSSATAWLLPLSRSLLLGHPLLGDGHRRLGRGLDVGGVDHGIGGQLLGQRAEPLVWRADAR